MALSLIYFCLAVPAIGAVLAFLVKNEKWSSTLVAIFSGVIMVASLGFLFVNVSSQYILFPSRLVWFEKLIFAAEIVIALGLLYLALKKKDWVVTSLVVIQTGILLWFHHKTAESLHVAANLFVDKFSILMAVVVGLIGGLIAIYTTGYMKDFHHSHKEYKDRRPVFLFLILIFLSAMFGVVFSNNLMWLYFFWEVTTVCSFLLIGYKQDQESVNNSFLALRWNLLGGLAFLLGIVFLYFKTGSIELNQLMGMEKTLVALPVACLAFAGLTKSAQLPCSSWLVGAMVAPTPVSALLHSSTMVKAGVYLVLRCSALFTDTLLGMTVALIGVTTFLIASFICISQNDAKKILAYSTIANLGLIVMCAGIGTYESLWAAMMLILFHALAKGLLFLCVGTLEQQIGSRDVESMSGLIIRAPRLCIILEIGIAGMFLAPFGMLISKWAVLQALVDYNPLFAILLAFGSAATLFFWVKWLGKVLTVERIYENKEDSIGLSQWIPLTVLSVLTVAICALFSVVAKYFIDPYIMEIFGKVFSMNSGNVIIISIMLTMMALFPLMFLQRGGDLKVVDPYLGGANMGSGTCFKSSFGREVQMHMANYYLVNYFNEKRLLRLGILITVLFSVFLFVG